MRVSSVMDAIMFCFVLSFWCSDRCGVVWEGLRQEGFPRREHSSICLHEMDLQHHQQVFQSRVSVQQVKDINRCGWFCCRPSPHHYSPPLFRSRDTVGLPSDVFLYVYGIYSKTSGYWSRVYTVYDTCGMYCSAIQVERYNRGLFVV